MYLVFDNFAMVFSIKQIIDREKSECEGECCFLFLIRLNEVIKRKVQFYKSCVAYMYKTDISDAGV